MGTGPSASWEEIVDRVSIKSNYYNVQAAADGWREIFRCLGDLEENLRTLKRNSDSWRGAAADGFRDRLDSYINDVDNLRREHERIVLGLEACVDHLRLAVSSIPIPSWMMTKLEDAQASYQMGDEVPGHAPGSFWHFYLKDVMGDIYSDIWIAGPAWKKVEAWLVDNENVAKQAYALLQKQYGGETGVIPEGHPVGPKLTDGSSSFDPTGLGGGGTGPGGMPDLNPSLGASGLAPGAGVDLNPAALEPWESEPWESDPPGGTELAGAGGGLISGAGGVGGLGTSGFSAPGVGGGGMSGPGGAGSLGVSGGPGAGGLPRGAGAVPFGGMGAGGGVGGARPGGTKRGRLPSLGTGVTPPGGPASSPKGTGATATRGPVAAPPARTDATDDEQDPESWLQEDKDPWGANDGAAPPVLGA